MKNKQEQIQEHLDAIKELIAESNEPDKKEEVKKWPVPSSISSFSSATNITIFFCNVEMNEFEKYCDKYALQFYARFVYQQIIDRDYGGVSDRNPSWRIDKTSPTGQVEDCNSPDRPIGSQCSRYKPDIYKIRAEMGDELWAALIME